MRAILNIVWLVFGGLWLAFEYVVAAVLLSLTIVGLPFAKQSLKLGGYALWPFGRTLIPAETRSVGLSALGNVLWLLLAGWWIALSHVIVGALFCLTIIGIPLGVGSFKMANAALVPFGKQVVPTKDLRYIPIGS